MDGPPPRLAGGGSSSAGRRHRPRSRTRAARPTCSCTAAGRLKREIIALETGSPWQLQVARLRCLRGIDTLTAAGLCAEIGDFERFARAEQLMSYVGLVAVREHHRRQPPARRDHQDRLRPRPPAVRRSGLALPQTPPGRQVLADQPRRPARRSDRDRLERATAPAPYLDTARAARQAPHDHRRRRRPRAHRLRLVDLPHRIDRRDTHPVG